MQRCLLLLDAYSLIYRAFFAIRSLTDPTGRPVNAIYGFAKMLRKLNARHRPSHMAAVFDLGAPRYRLDLLPSYKAQRPAMPDDLEYQLPFIRAVLAAMRVAVVEKEGEEADDLIATLAVRASQHQDQVLIASNDKDFMQLVGPQIRIVRLDDADAPPLDSDGVRRKTGVTPSQIVDYLSLLGDASDNIPGVPGVGAKTAVALIREHGDLDGIIAHATELDKPRLRPVILAHANRLRANRNLISLRTDIDLPVTIDNLEMQRCDISRLRELFRELGFRSLLAELEEQHTPRTGELFPS